MTEKWMSSNTAQGVCAILTTLIYRSERSGRVTIEVSLLLSGISVAFAIFFGMSSKRRNEKKDIAEETEGQVTKDTMVMMKLENIADDIKDIKREEQREPRRHREFAGTNCKC